MFKRTTITLSLIVAGHTFALAEIPMNPTRQQIIASCLIEKVTVQERVALQQSVTKLDAAELLQSMYQDRLEKVKAAIYPFNHLTNLDAYGSPEAWKAALDKLFAEGKVYIDAGKEIDELIVTLKAAPAPKTVKKKKA